MLLQEYSPAFFRTEVMLFSVHLFEESVVFGKIGIADLVFDHDSGEPLSRPVTLEKAPRKEQHAQKEVEEVSQKNVKQETEKDTDHLSNVTERELPVNAGRGFLAFPGGWS